MGDVIHALPVAAALHQVWPETEICWLIHPAFQHLVEHHPAVSKIILFPREEFRGVIGGLSALSWARTLGAWKPDLAIDLQGLLRSALMAFSSGARHRVGLSDAREGAGFFYSNIAKVDTTSHAVIRYIQVLKTLGISCDKPQFDLPKGSIPPGFSLATPFVVIHPYARGEGKNLTREQVVAFAETMKSTPVVLVGQGEKMEHLPLNVLDWSRRTSLLELIGLLRHASFVVSSDSGPMHLAAALQPKHLIAIHRWSDPLRVGPYPHDALVWKNGKLKSHDQLTEEVRIPGRTPTLEEMRELGRFVFKKLK